MRGYIGEEARGSRMLEAVCEVSEKVGRDV